MADFTTRDGARLHYQEDGAPADSGAETVVLLTGWSQTRAMYDRFIEELGDRYRVVSYDYRNHGESGSTDNGARIAALAEDLLELIDSLRIDKAHFAGNSMGCSVLWSFIDLFGTDRIRSLVLIDQPSVCALVPWLGQEDLADVGAIVDFPGAAVFVQGVMGDDAAAVRRGFLESMLSPDLSPEDVDWLYEQNLKLRMPYGARLLLDHIFQDWRDVLPRIDVPTLVTGGEVSHVDVKSQQWIADQIPGARLRIFTRAEGGDHFPFFGAPKVFAEAFTEFVDSAR